MAPRRAYFRERPGPRLAGEPFRAKLVRALKPAGDPAEASRREQALNELGLRIIASNATPGSPSLQIIQHVGDRWSPLILLVLATGTYRHTELHRTINAFSDISKTTHVSQHILTKKLRSLERDGLLARKVWPVVPPRTDYALTTLGQALADWLLKLMDWAHEYTEQILAARERYDGGGGPHEDA